MDISERVGMKPGRGRGVRHAAAALAMACAAGGAWAAAAGPGSPTGSQDAPRPFVQVAGVAGEFSPYAPMRLDAAGRAGAPREAHEGDDEVAPGPRADARASAVALSASDDAGASTLPLWLAGLGAMLFVAWRLKGD